MKIGSLFSGVGGLDLAVEAFFGAETAWHCEVDPEPSKVLAARWPGVPNLGDVTQVDWAAVESVDIMCGGFPCQDVSLAGRRAGMKAGTRSGLWSEFARAIDVVKPRIVVIENVRGLLSAEAGGDVEPCPWCVGDGADEYRLRALDAVVADLSDLGFDAEWTGLRAADVGAPHGRFRFFLVAYRRGEAGEFWAGLRAGKQSWVGRGRPDDGTRPHGDDVALLRTPVAAELGGGPLHPDVAGERGATRLSGQVLALGGHLLPTPSAASPNEEEPIEAWVERRERVKDATGNGNGFGMPLGVAVRLLREEGGPRGQASEVRPDEALRSVRRGDGAQKIRKPAGGSDSIPEQTDVLTELREQSRGGASRYTSMACAAGPRAGGVCGVRDDGTATHSSHRPEPCEQCAGELGDVVRELPLEAPLGRGSRVREAEVNWGEYERAIRVWEAVLGRPAPAPTRPDGKNGNHRLNAEFVSWMMGYPAGWVTDIIDRKPAIKACGNGVVPQQAYAGLEILWPRVTEAVAA